MGLEDPSLATCGANGTDLVFNATNYTCARGYFKGVAPSYCRGTDLWRVVQRWTTNPKPATLHHPECVPGLSNTTFADCDADGSGAFVDAEDYQCNGGYYVISAPRYCARV
jgi:hypothetical protein